MRNRSGLTDSGSNLAKGRRSRAGADHLARWFTGSFLTALAACSLAGLDEFDSGGPGGAPADATTDGIADSDAADGIAPFDGAEDATDAACATHCGNACADLATDTNNCGSCAHTCAAGYACTDGICGNAVVDVSSGAATCAVLRAGEVWCWGRNVWGEVGIPPAFADSVCYLSDACQTKPVKIAKLSGVVEVATGGEASCARTNTGDVWCWGSNAAGLLGHTPNTDSNCIKAGGPDPGTTDLCSAEPQKVQLPTGVKATQLVMGHAAACVLTTTKQVYCWGKNGCGEVQSPPDSAVHFTPTLNQNGAGADRIAINFDGTNACSAVCAAQWAEVRCWGSSTEGNIFPAPAPPVAGCIGDPACSPTGIVVPQTFSPPTGAVSPAGVVTAGYLVGCTIRVDGSVVCWGQNNYGQSGLASLGPEHFDPRVLTGLPTISAVSNRYLTTLMIDDKRTVWALGWGDEGQIGDGKFGNDICPRTKDALPENQQHCANQPVQVPGLTDVVKVSASSVSAAITRDGKLWMWGPNYFAALGHPPVAQPDGGLAIVATPTLVTGLP